MDDPPMIVNSCYWLLGHTLYQETNFTSFRCETAVTPLASRSMAIAQTASYPQCGYDAVPHRRTHNGNKTHTATHATKPAPAILTIQTIQVTTAI